MLRNREIRVLIFICVITCAAASSLCFFISNAAGLICAASIICISGVFYLFTNYRYKRIAELSEYIRKMSDGGAPRDIRDNAEGELSILKNDIYKLAFRLSEQASALRQEKTSLKDTLFDISHQLKTPLTSLTVMADLLENENLPEEKRREFMDNLQAGLSRMDWLVKALLKMARLDAGTEPLKTEAVYAGELINKAAGQVMPMIDLKGQRLEINIGGAPQVICDKNWTVEALVNILKNASEYTPESGVITVTADDNPICARITVTDSGGGIDSGDLPHLFRRFYRGRHSGKDSVGIGLAMSLSIMRRQSGDIEVKTEKAARSSFSLKFYKAVM